jgi:hypothetical protein
MQRHRGGPSHAALISLLETLLPPYADEALVYHSPRRNYDPAAWHASLLIAAVFLHRPFTLDRRRVPYGTLVLSSHVRFDELLTTGWNVALCRALGVPALPIVEEHDVTPVRGCLRLTGWKGKPDRHMGLFAPLQTATPLSALFSRVLAEYACAAPPFDPVLHWQGDPERPIRYIASLNAFDAAILNRLQTAAKRHYPDCRAEEILVLTGQTREEGAYIAGMYGLTAVCVGHRACEDWGVAWLAAQVQATLGIETLVVSEAEPPRVRRVPQQSSDGSCLCGSWNASFTLYR